MRILVLTLLGLLLCWNNLVHTETGPNIDDDPQRSLHAFLRRKTEDVRDVVRHGYVQSQLPPMDPLKLESLKLLMQESAGFVNLTLKKASVTGLSDFQIRDVASNLDAMQASVLLTYPKLRISGIYRIKGFLNPPFSQSVSDEGHFEVEVRHGGTTWATYLLPLNSEEVRVTQTNVRSYFDDVTHNFKSFSKGSNASVIETGAELMETAASAMVEKIQRIIENKLRNAFSVSLAKSSWTPPRGELYSNHSNNKHLVRRQVPCMNGEELDEYVDTLLSFAGRIVRLMEPVGVPNMTTWIDNQLIVFLYNARVRGVSTITRQKPAYVFCPTDTITLGMVVGFDTLNITANYRVLQDYSLLLFNGDAEVKITNFTAFVQLTQLTRANETTQSLDVLKVWRLGKIQILLRGLGSITRAVSMLLTHTINQDPAPFIKVVEKQAIKVMREQLANVSVPLFSLI